VSPVFRHGRLRLYLLKLLDESPRHGYEVIRLLQDRFMGVYAPSPGTIYPRLARLEEDGLVTHEEVDGKKVYSITDKGRDLFAESLREPPAPDKIRSDFCFVMLFAHLLPPTLIDRLIRERIAWYRHHIGQMESCDGHEAPPGGRLINGLGLAIYRSAAAYLEENRAAFVAGLQRTAVRPEASQAPAVAS